jgi:mannose-6-phosphate isomerase-like protein (cupin superfamily)
MSEPKRSRNDCPAFVTLDGSLVRELMHPGKDGRQSLAEAIVSPGSRTAAHRHHRSEEIYHFLAGNGIMELGDRRFRVTAGDTVRIAPGTRHALINDSDSELRLLCCCAPPYSHDDTELLDQR